MGVSKNRPPPQEQPFEPNGHGMTQQPTRSAIKFDLFADAARKRKIESLGDPLLLIARHIDFDHLTQIVDALLPKADTSKGWAPCLPHCGNGAHPHPQVFEQPQRRASRVSNPRSHELPALLSFARQCQCARSQHHLALAAAPRCRWQPSPFSSHGCATATPWLPGSLRANH